MNFEILTPRFREMVTLNYSVNSVEVWSHTPLGMSCDLIKILVINHKRLWYISTFLNTDDVILKLYTSLCQKAKCTLEHCIKNVWVWLWVGQWEGQCAWPGGISHHIPIAFSCPEILHATHVSTNTVLIQSIMHLSVSNYWLKHPQLVL